MKEYEKDLQRLWQSWEFLDNSISVSFDVSQEVCHACHAIGCSCSEMRSDALCQQAMSNPSALVGYTGKLWSDQSKQAVEPMLHVGISWYRHNMERRTSWGPPVVAGDPPALDRFG